MTATMVDRVEMAPPVAAALDRLTRPHEVCEAGWAVRSAVLHDRRVDDDESQKWVERSYRSSRRSSGSRRGPTSRDLQRCAGYGRPSASRCA